MLCCFTVNHYTYAQDKDKILNAPGFYNTFQWSSQQNLYLCPQLYFSLKKIYIEARYNYEYLNTGSLYVGYGFANQNEKFGNLTATLYGGIFGGERWGIAPGYNCEYKVGKYFFAAEGQYTFDANDSYQNYFWTWANSFYNIHPNISLGASFQISAFYRGEIIPQLSPLLHLQYKWVGLDFYAYNLWEDVPVFGVGFEISVD